MRKSTGLGLLLCLLLGVIGVAAQDQGAMPPPKVLVILREFLKPGKTGMAHEKTESAFVQAFRSAKWPTQYLAVDSLSGKPRSLFLVGYDSFDAWEKDAQAIEKNPTLEGTLGRAGLADGELQSDADSSIVAYREDLSFHANVAIAKMRYFEIDLFQLKPGHTRDFEELAKMYTAAYEKMPAGAHWATYQSVFTQFGDSFVIFVPLASAKEVDAFMTQGKQFEQALGEDGMKKLNELSAASVQSQQSNLFIFNPRESYVGEDWIKADPTFWKPKAAAAMKPAAPAAQ
jgi:hypothetical protein